MSRGYQKIKTLLPMIEGMTKKGKSHKEIEKELGLTGDRPIHNLLKRERRKAQQIPKQQGRKAAVSLTEYKYENRRLKMENELLRDFLRLAGRM
jgi:hypothetical protein